ncbi:hypothetical protein, partial [Marinobacter sp.]|uniref:hypothetical protein n=1 Tax=Marinobacter sp. TaxID=50741 RepID=UPI0035675726
KFVGRLEVALGVLDVVYGFVETGFQVTHVGFLSAGVEFRYLRLREVYPELMVTSLADHSNWFRIIVTGAFVGSKHRRFGNSLPRAGFCRKLASFCLSTRFILCKVLSVACQGGAHNGLYYSN